MLDSLSKSPEIALAALAVLCVTVIFGQAEIEGAGKAQGRRAGPGRGVERFLASARHHQAGRDRRRTGAL